MRYLFRLSLAAILLSILLPCRFGAGLWAEPIPVVTDLTELLQPGRHAVSLRIDDRNRRMIFFTPTGFRPGTPLPLVLFFHGAGGSCVQAAHTYGWLEKAEQEQFFVAFPEGLPTFPDSPGSFLLNPNIWRDGRSEFLSSNIKDVHFVEVLLGRLQATLPIDSHRIYASGFSNGAAMTFTLGAHFPDRIAAIAPVSSQSFVHVDSLTRPLPVFYITGSSDPLIPYHGGTVTLPWGTTRVMPPVQETVDKWAQLDGCPTEPHVVSDTQGVRVLRYGPGRGDSEIVFTTVEGNGHHWPTSVEPLPRALSGPALDSINATDQIWDFFIRHPLP
jgi:polyhydroxybutyrate depolymerase